MMMMMMMMMMIIIIIITIIIDIINIIIIIIMIIVIFSFVIIIITIIIINIIKTSHFPSKLLFLGHMSVSLTICHQQATGHPIDHFIYWIWTAFDFSLFGLNVQHLCLDQN